MSLVNAGYIRHIAMEANASCNAGPTREIEALKRGLDPLSKSLDILGPLTQEIEGSTP